jgi:hypothetical protein
MTNNLFTGVKPPKKLKPFTPEIEKKLTKVKNLAGAEASLLLALAVDRLNTHTIIHAASRYYCSWQLLYPEFCRSHGVPSHAKF